MLFLLLGIASWQVEGDSEEGFVVGVSLTFVVLALIIVALARFVNVVLTSILFRAIKGKSKWRLNRYEIEILFASGLVKGAVPFALTASAALID
jgi:NhaP-type Na+/H+ or K+/H+ antiporter